MRHSAPSSVAGELRSVEIWDLGRDGRYRRARATSTGKLRNISGMLGLTLDLDRLWSDVSRLADAR